MEDLLQRVATICKVSTDSAGDAYRVRLHGLRKLRWGNLEPLRWSLLDIERYRWQAASQSGAFVQMMVYEADDLVLNLTPMRQIRRWAGGALEGQMLSMLGRLERRGATHRGSGGSTQARRG